MDNQEIVQVPSEDVEVIDSTEIMLQAARRREQLLVTLKEHALKATNSGDWVDQNGTPYCQGSGAEKMMRRFGLKVWNTRTEKFKETDEDGDYYYFRVTGKVGFNESEFIEAIGNCSSRDQFFAKREGKLLPQSEVDITNIEKSAYTNFIVNGVTRFLGLRNPTWEELKEFGIDKEKVAKVKYKSGKKSSKWDDDQRKKAERITDFLLADADGDKKIAADSLEKLTTFTAKDGKTVKGKRVPGNLSGKQVDILFEKLESKILEFENAGQDTGESEADDGSAG